MSVFHLWEGDCLERLKEIEPNSIDAIVTDPPYGLGFMGKKWDIGVPVVELFAECLCVLKPGGHLLAFGGSRTYHRLAVAVEDAGFEIRDQIMWVYGSGFPKSQNVSKAIDKAAGAEREKIPQGNPVKRMIPGADQDKTGSWIKDNGRTYQSSVEVPATDAARQWNGWGTALKPAHEPIVVARKPLIGTVAANVLEHGTGALNIDGCRVDTGGDQPKGSGRKPLSYAGQNHRPYHDREPAPENVTPDAGRWPANLIHDGSDEVLAAFPDAKGQSGAVGPRHGAKSSVNCYGDYGPREEFTPRIDSSTSAARFFYCAKASRKDRHEGLDSPGPQFKHDGTLRKVENTATKGNNHPTVKPTDLMRYLVRLVTPPGGTVLDPFMGSGSTGKAAILEGFDFIGIEKEAEYLPIARARLIHAGGTDAEIDDDDRRDELI